MTNSLFFQYLKMAFIFIFEGCVAKFGILDWQLFSFNSLKMFCYVPVSMVSGEKPVNFSSCSPIYVMFFSDCFDYNMLRHGFL